MFQLCFSICRPQLRDVHKPSQGPSPERAANPSVESLLAPPLPIAAASMEGRPAELARALAPSSYTATKTGVELGKGGFGKVMLAKDSSNQDIAIKYVPYCFKNGSVSAHRVLLYRSEVTILALISAPNTTHPNVLKMYARSAVPRYSPSADTAQADSNVDPDGKYLKIFMEFAEGEDLRKYFDKNNQRLTPEEVGQITRQLLSALEFLHYRPDGRAIIHRDIKPENIIISSAKSIKLVDFGVARILDAQQDTIPRADVGHTKQYSAPEVLRHEPETRKVDIWSVGITAYELLQGQRPYAGRKSSEVLASIFAGTELVFVPDVNQEIAALIRSALQADPMARPTAVELAAQLTV